MLEEQLKILPVAPLSLFYFTISYSYKYMKLIEGKDRTYACEVVKGQDCSSNRMARKIAIPDK